MQISEIESVAISIISILADNNVKVGDVRTIFETAEKIISRETPIKKIDV